MICSSPHDIFARRIPLTTFRCVRALRRGCQRTLERTCSASTDDARVRLTLEQTLLRYCRNAGVPACFVFAWTDGFHAIAKMRCQKRAIVVGKETAENEDKAMSSHIDKETYASGPSPRKRSPLRLSNPRPAGKEKSRERLVFSGRTLISRYRICWT